MDRIPGEFKRLPVRVTLHVCLHVHAPIFGVHLGYVCLINCTYKQTCEIIRFNIFNIFRYSHWLWKKSWIWWNLNHSRPQCIVCFTLNNVWYTQCLYFYLKNPTSFNLRVLLIIRVSYNRVTRYAEIMT